MARKSFAVGQKVWYAVPSDFWGDATDREEFGHKIGCSGYALDWALVEGLVAEVFPEDHRRYGQCMITFSQVSMTYGSVKVAMSEFIPIENLMDWDEFCATAEEKFGLTFADVVQLSQYDLQTILLQAFWKAGYEFSKRIRHSTFVVKYSNAGRDDLAIECHEHTVQFRRYNK